MCLFGQFVNCHVCWSIFVFAGEFVAIFLENVCIRWGVLIGTTFLENVSCLLEFVTMLVRVEKVRILGGV